MLSTLQVQLLQRHLDEGVNKTQLLVLELHTVRKEGTGSMMPAARTSDLRFITFFGTVLVQNTRSWFVEQSG